MSTPNNTSKAPKTVEKLSLAMLIAIVVSSMIGSGVDGLPQNMSATSEVGPILIAWALTGFGVFFIAKTFITLSDIRPDLQAGIYMYSQEGFGNFIAFIVAWGYWLMTIFSNVAFAIMAMDVLNYFLPGDFTGGNNIASIIGASILIWGFNILVQSGTKVAGLLNFIGTIAKLIPLCIFVIIVVYFFESAQFNDNFWGTTPLPTETETSNSLYHQIIAPLNVALWCFIGIESAVALSGRAKSKADISKATLWGFILSLFICILISVLPFGVLSQEKLSLLPTPSTSGVMQEIVGNWGEILVNLGVLISILSSWLTWTMICAEIPMVAAKNGTFPKLFAKTNKNNAASFSLILSTLVMQATLVLVYFANNAWLTMLSITTIAVLPAYLGSTAYLLKLGVTGEFTKYRAKGRWLACITGAIGIFFCVFMAYVSKIEYVILMPILLTIGIPFYIWTRRRNNVSEKVFNSLELIYLAILLLIDIISIIYYFNVLQH
ncbi:basic amino acid/polyamine antiporter [Ignatzschineria sp. LJL83]